LQGSEESDAPSWPTETLLLLAVENDPRPFPWGALSHIGSQKNPVSKMVHAWAQVSVTLANSG